MRAEATITIRAQPRRILSFVADLRRYRRADRKIAAVHNLPSVSEDALRSRTRYRGRLRGLPTPAEWQTVTLEPWERLTLRSEPGQWINTMAIFEGGFVCQPIDQSTTEVTHYEHFHFNPLLRPLARAFLARWLQHDLEDEMERLKELIEAEIQP